ncbi:glutamic acid-rich protein-like [Melanotaenia boesemani]|uniref:glutamic acid-rich protein-like n=1 Tax=Melanotaenia boesemani TaxID=1250792 RepID=UPI001C03F84E|nr:glutamic acid-rich protein-like [Melanotaenia boesemani]
MLARNAAMKTIRMEYERYLEKNFPRWQQQLQEKTQMAEKKKMEDYLRSYLKETEQERMPMSTEDEPLLLQSTPIRPQKNIPQAYSTQEYSDYNQDRSSQYPNLQSSWLTHTQSQTGRFPVRVLGQTHLHPFSHHLASTGVLHHPQSRQDAAYWDPSDHNYPWPRAAGIPPGSWGQLYSEEPRFDSRVSETGKQEGEISRAPSSKGERGGGRSSSRLSPELDIKPVRLPSAHGASSGSSRDSSVTSSREKRKKREKRERTQHSSSDSERCVSQELSRTSSEIVIASVAVAQSAMTETSEEEHTRSSRRSKRDEGLTAGSPKLKKAVKEQTMNYNKESQPAGEEPGSSSEESMKKKAGNQRHNENKESCREEQGSGSNGVKKENRFKVETEKQEKSSSEQSSTEENDEEERRKPPGDGENDKKESENNESDEESDDNEVSAKINTTEEEVGTAEEDEDDQGDDEEPNKLKNNDAEIRKQDEDGDGSEGSEGKKEDEEDGESEDEEQRSEKEEENTDSEDDIISPQEKRPKQMQIIPEDGTEEDEDDEECKEGSSNNDSNEDSDEDDVENLLAPQDQSKTEEENGKADGNPKASCHVDIFQVVDARSKTEHLSDSDEFDHFYD